MSSLSHQKVNPTILKNWGGSLRPKLCINIQNSTCRDEKVLKPNKRWVRTSFVTSFAVCLLKKLIFSSKTKKLRARPHGFFWKRRLFPSVFAFLLHVNGVFGLQKGRFLKTVARVEFFENAGLSFSCHETEFFEHGSVIHRTAYFHCLNVFVWTSATRTRIRYAWTRIFSKQEEEKSVFKNMIWYL